MPLHNGITMSGGNMDSTTQGKLNKFFAVLDKSIRETTQQRRLTPNFVKFLHPINYVVFETINDFKIIATNQNVGGMPQVNFQDFKTQNITLEQCAFLVQRDLMYQNPFGISFDKNIIDQNEEFQRKESKKIAENYINQEIIEIEKLNNIVRINPIFNGRDFLINKELAFMLSPFSEPFNTIFSDHIKPCVEKIDSIKCFRADNIYDNKPIIDDIWKSINEAGVIISELTGRNPNVFYETGIAHTIGKEVILITQDINDVPFDLRHLRCIVYEYTPRGIQLLESNLENTIRQIRSRLK